jgi:hypothetical protein
MPRELPADGSILVWTPPDGRPLEVSSDERLGLLFNRLLPVGPPAARAPRTTASAPAGRSG